MAKKRDDELNPGQGGDRPGDGRPDGPPGRRQVPGLFDGGEKPAPGSARRRGKGGHTFQRERAGEPLPDQRVGGASTVDQAWTVVFQEARQGGGTCPVCDQRVQVYRRSISRTMLEFLTLAGTYGLGGDSLPWIPTDDLVAQVPKIGGEYGKLRYWRLIETGKDDQDRTSVRLTGHGVDFLAGRLPVRKYALVYNGDVLGYEGEKVTPDDIRGGATPGAGSLAETDRPIPDRATPGRPS